MKIVKKKKIEDNKNAEISLKKEQVKEKKLFSDNLNNEKVDNNSDKKKNEINLVINHIERKRFFHL